MSGALRVEWSLTHATETPSHFATSAGPISSEKSSSKGKLGFLRPFNFFTVKNPPRIRQSRKIDFFGHWLENIFL
jgi:hypothetical protein